MAAPQLVADFGRHLDPAPIAAGQAGEGAKTPIRWFDDEPQKFGFRWFAPALLRHRSLWRDILLASMAIQVIALATPLMTQILIDKVIPHHSHGTLFAVALGLSMFLVFNAVLTWLRQFLQTHTGNRVDALLASDVMHHLLRLPLPYFEHRPTGTTVARLQAVETIREFLTGAALGFLLDAPFLLVALSVAISGTCGSGAGTSPFRPTSTSRPMARRLWAVA